jgi:hypothetical protein
MSRPGRYEEVKIERRHEVSRRGGGGIKGESLDFAP